MFFEIAGHSQTVFVVARHADGECLHSPQDQPAIEGPEDCPGGVLNEFKSVGERLVVQDDRTANPVAVPIQVFRRAMDDDIRAMFEGALEVGTHKGIVHHKEQPVPAGKGRHGG